MEAPFLCHELGDLISGARKTELLAPKLRMATMILLAHVPLLPYFHQFLLSFASARREGVARVGPEEVLFAASLESPFRAFFSLWVVFLFDLSLSFLESSPMRRVFQEP